MDELGRIRADVLIQLWL